MAEVHLMPTFAGYGIVSEVQLSSLKNVSTKRMIDDTIFGGNGPVARSNVQYVRS